MAQQKTKKPRNPDNNSGRIKYDWEMLKAKFLCDDIPEASNWLRKELGFGDRRPTRQMEEATRGWSLDWKTNRRRIALEAIRLSGKNRASRMAEALDNMRDFFETVAFGARDAETRLSVDDAKEVWKILRIENGLPSTISRNQLVATEDPEDALDALQDEPDAENQDSEEVEDSQEGDGGEVVL